MTSRSRYGVWLVAGVLVSAGGVSACGSAGHPSAPGAPASAQTTGKPDARWAALDRCLVDGERARDHGAALDGSVLETAGQLRVFDGPSGFFLADVIYDGTFARARAEAERTVPEKASQGNFGRGSALAVANVAYFFTGATWNLQTKLITACLTRIYPGAPTWPRNEPPATLAAEALPGR